MLSAHQAFVVKPILSVPLQLPCQPVLTDPCVPLLNGWFYAPTDEEAALVMLRARPSVITATTAGTDTMPNWSSTCSHVPSSNEDCDMDTEEEHNTACLDDTANKDVEKRLCDCVTACEPKEASKASDVRSVLVTRLGKSDATLVLKGCTTTVAKNAQGQSSRILRASTGEAVKLKT